MSWIRTALSLLGGSIVGYAYYRLIGCTTGHCLIAGNPWASTAYFALLGWLLAGGGGVLSRWSHKIGKHPE